MQNLKPDEFAIIKNKPLEIPNKFTLPTPQEASNVEDQDLKDSNLNNLSEGERSFLDKTKELKADKDIHKKINKDKKPNKLQRLF